jgi:hypothetical protein
MSDDDLENDDLEVGDEDEAEEGLEAAAEDVAEDDGGDDAPVPAAKGKAKAAVSVDELPSIEAKNKERDALAKAMEEFLRVAARCRKSRPMWSPILPRSLTTSTAAGLSKPVLAC